MDIHIGTNDLALSLGLRNRWMAMTGDLLLDAARGVHSAGRRFGIGGIGRVGQMGLPVPPDLVYAEYARTGATDALLSRSFTHGRVDLAREVPAARARLGEWRHRSPEDIEAAHRELGEHARAATSW